MKFSTLPAIAALCATTFAQTFTDCNPLNATCPKNTALGQSNYTVNFQKNMMSDNVWNWTEGSGKYGSNGIDFIIADKGDAPTVKSKFYIFFGTVEVIMKAASGQGIVSSVVIQSDDLDEIDWEWIGGNSTHVQTNYFGKGNTTSYDRAIWHPMSSPQDAFHNYTTDWSREKIDFYIDGQLVRTLKYGDANGGKNFPQTPSDVRLGIWAGGDPKNNNYTIEWAGGVTDYKDTPYTMTVKSLRITDATTGYTQYEYGDRSGSMESIKLLNTTAAIKLDGSNSQSVEQRWQGLSQNAKIAIAASILGTALIFVCVFAFCCVKQRRLGKHERLLEDAKFEKDRSELLAFRAEMGRQRNEKLAMMQGGYMNQPMQSSYGMQPMSNARGYQRY